MMILIKQRKSKRVRGAEKRAGIDLLGDGSVAWAERGRHGGGSDVADLG